jgi:hypothetical protein
VARHAPGWPAPWRHLPRRSGSLCEGGNGTGGAAPSLKPPCYRQRRTVRNTIVPFGRTTRSRTIRHTGVQIRTVRNTTRPFGRTVRTWRIRHTTSSMRLGAAMGCGENRAFAWSGERTRTPSAAAAPKVIAFKSDLLWFGRQRTLAHDPKPHDKPSKAQTAAVTITAAPTIKSSSPKPLITPLS